MHQLCFLYAPLYRKEVFHGLEKERGFLSYEFKLGRQGNAMEGRRLLVESGLDVWRGDIRTATLQDHEKEAIAEKLNSFILSLKTM